MPRPGSDAQLEFGYEHAPEFTVRVSARAKYPGLRYSVRNGLEVVVPRGLNMSKADIREMIERHRDWIHKTRKRIAAHAEHMPIDPEPPREIRLPHFDETRSVEYVSTRRKSVVVEEEGDGLVVRGNISERDLCRDACRRWLIGRYEDFLGDMLLDLSRAADLPFRQVRVRGQKTRWGSCSSDGNINLNIKLIYLPLPVMQYVMLHELCHTVHMNHSRSFWRLVEELDPDYREHEKALKDANRLIPDWLLA